MNDRKMECPICHELTREGSMIWLNGLCTCPECFKKRIQELREEKNGNNDNN